MAQTRPIKDLLSSPMAQTRLRTHSRALWPRHGRGPMVEPYGPDKADLIVEPYGPDMVEDPWSSPMARTRLRTHGRALWPSQLQPRRQVAPSHFFFAFDITCLHEVIEYNLVHPTAIYHACLTSICDMCDICDRHGTLPYNSSIDVAQHVTDDRQRSLTSYGFSLQCKKSFIITLGI